MARFSPWPGDEPEKAFAVPDRTIQAILRHEDVSTTTRHYIKSVGADVVEAMKKLELRIVCAANVQQPEVGGLVN
jgi:integrase